MSKPYNGHHCWNCWNVALWLGNDEGLYNEARHTIRVTTSKGEAARRLLNILPPETPDGAKYTFTALRSALVGLDS